MKIEIHNKSFANINANKSRKIGNGLIVFMKRDCILYYSEFCKRS